MRIINTIRGIHLVSGRHKVAGRKGKTDHPSRCCGEGKGELMKTNQLIAKANENNISQQE